MATYGGWTEVREYRVWQDEETYAVVTVAKHRNGWFHVYEDGSGDWERKTRSESAAFGYAIIRSEWLENEAKETCRCHQWAEVEQVECYSSELNPYDSPHGVRIQVVDEIENRDITGDL